LAQRRTIRELLVKLGIDADTKAVNDFDKSLGSVKSTMVGVAKVAAAVAGAFIAVGTAAFGMAVATATAGDEASKAAKRIGVTAEEMQELTFAAGQSGAAMADVEVGFRTLARNALMASQGTGEAAKAFKRLEVDATDSNGELKGSLDLFTELAGALGGLTNEQERSALAQQLFGRGGAKLLPLLTAGAGGIEELRKQAQALGLVMSNEAAKASEDFVDRMGEVRGIMTGLRNEIGAEFMPVFSDMMIAFREWFLSNKDLINQKIDKWAGRVADAFREVGVWLQKVDKFVRENLGGWDRVIRTTAIVGSIAAITAGLIAFGPAILAAAEGVFIFTAALATLLLTQPEILIVVAALGLLALIVEDIVTFMQGGDSVIGRFFDAWERGGPVLNQVKRIFEGLKSIVVTLTSAVLAQFRIVGEVFGLMKDIGLELLDVIFPGIKTAVDNITNSLTGEFADSLGFVASLIERIAAAIASWPAEIQKSVDYAKGLREEFSSLTDNPVFSALASGARAIAGPAQEAMDFATTPQTALGASLASQVSNVSTSNRTTTIGGDTNTFNIGSGGNQLAEFQEVQRKEGEKRRRHMSAAIAGAEM